jgi:hypothetical protein
MRADGISMMSNDATFEAGMAKANCGAQMMGAGANLIATDAQVIVGVAGMLPSVGRIAAEGGALRSFATAEPKHHVFPQQFRQEFGKLGIDIDRYTLQMPQGVHSEIHSMGWNADWEEFLAGGPTAAEAYDFAANMMHEYDLFRYLPFREY